MKSKRTTDKKGKDSVTDLYEKMMNGYNPGPFIQREWEMKDGLYVQYSAYKEKTPVQSGIACTIKAL